ncbi:Alginate export [Novosphingobium sp. CF614]|uniref:alginate export family protein n=1 Tax=Novosphingobium sp. CF614 TaxID=1884364 RepID=UPI0008E51751|nr:alginate export family protein [Novosphingobium sp. CF614]SFG49489.1 Alginate export [Novosphingobium sp. CF614]
MRFPVALILGAAIMHAPVSAAEPDEAGKPTILTTERYNEDWSDLADPANRIGHWTEPFKYIPLDSTGAYYLTTGLELRLRNEKFENNLWGSADAPDDGYLWIRALPYADLRVGKVRAFVQPIIAYAAGVAPAPGPVDQTRVDLLQGFADIQLGLGADTTLHLRAGRELIGLGTERLIGTRYGPNVPLAFDGGRAILHSGRTTLNLIYVRPVESRTGSFDDRTSDTRTLWGAYATRSLDGTAANGIDTYYLGYRNAAARYDQGAGRETRHTLGMRVFGKAADWRWNVEGIYQFGRFAGGPISAWSIATEIVRSFPGAPLAPSVTVRANAISGDHDPSDRRLQTFNALFPKGKYFGELSPIGPYNIINGHVGTSFDLGGGVSAGLATMAYWRESRGDGIYDIPGHLLRSGRGSSARFIGKQAEATVSWLVTPELELSASLSAFAPGAFIRDTGSARTIHMLGLESNFRF